MLQHTKNEKGVIFLLAVVLLFLISGALIIYLEGYRSQLIVYNALESSFVRATIDIIEEMVSLD